MTHSRRFAIALILGSVLSATAEIAAVPAKPSSRESLTIDNWTVAAGRADESSKRQVQVSSQPLRKYKVLELLDGKDLPNKKSRRLLLAAGDSPQRRDLHTPVGGELWQVDSDGTERFVSAGVFQAKLSPDGEKLVYATFLRTVDVQTGDGRLLLEVTRGYDPSWKPDGRSIVLSRAAEGSALNTPESLRICTIDIETGSVRNLTDGMFDDVRPEFYPSGHWVIFVSGGRTGIASFWRVSADGGDPTQLTNIGATAIDDRFVPTPFKRTLWSSNGKWFLYDYKVGDKEEIWGLEFGPDGHLVRALNIAAGLNPHWVADGVSVTVQQMVDGEPKPTIVELPQ
jgi:TolB protein